MSTSSEKLLQSIATAKNVLYPLTAGVGIIANVVVFLVIAIWERYRGNRTVANLFTANLAVADAVFLVTLPLNMPAVLDPHGWTHGIVACKFTEIIKYINFRASILFLTTMSLDRYLAIVYTLESRMVRTRSSSIKVCVFLWAISIASSVPAALYADIENAGLHPRCTVMFPGFKSNDISETYLYNLIKNISGVGDNYAGFYDYPTENDVEKGVVQTCIYEEHADSASYKAWVYVNFLAFFVLPVVVTLFCHASIVKATLSRQINSTMKKNQYQVAVMVAILVTVFIICWMPYQVWQMITLAGKRANYWGECDIIDTVFLLMAWSNSALNPILYSLSSQRFRDKAIKAWRYVRYGYQRSMLMEQQSVRTIQTKMTTLRSKNVSPTSGPPSRIQTPDQTNPTYKADSSDK